MWLKKVVLCKPLRTSVKTNRVGPEPTLHPTPYDDSGSPNFVPRRLVASHMSCRGDLVLHRPGFIVMTSPTL